MIELIPAIDIIDGKCVRLTKGDYNQKTVYNDSPADVARQFEDMGFKRLHVVDLDGAKSKHIVNDHVLKAITDATNLKVDFGGGLKTDDDLKGADVRNGKISINGWKEDSAEELLPFLKQYVDHGVKNVLCTEISKDGTLQGPAIELYRQIMDAYPTLHLIASGGVGCTNDIRNLNESGIPAVVFGKAFYEGKINIEELWQL